MTAPQTRLVGPRVIGHGPSRSVPQDTAVFITAPTRSVPAAVRWSFLLFVFSLPFEYADLPYITSGSMSLAKLCGLIFFAFYFWYYNPFFQKRSFPPISLAAGWFLAYIAILALSGLLLPEEYFRSFLSRLFRIVQLFVFFWVASSLLEGERLARSVLLTFSFGCVLLALGTIFGLPGLSETMVRGRTRPLDFNPNYVAALMAYAAVILIGLRLDKSRQSLWQKLMLPALTLPLFFLMVSTGSRAGSGAFVIGATLYLLPYRSSRRKMTAFMLGFLALAVMVFMALSNPVSSERWQAYADEGHTSGRNEIYAAAFEMISERPILGWHPARSLEELGWRVGMWGERGAHNLFLYLLLEVGLVGTIPFLIGLGLCVWAAWKARWGRFGLLPLALLTTLLAYNMLHTGLVHKPTWLFFALALGAASAVNRARRRPKALINQRAFRDKERTLRSSSPRAFLYNPGSRTS